MTLDAWFSHPVWQSILGMLLHFVWQGFAIAGGLVVLDALLRPRWIQARYTLSLVALCAMIAAPLVTVAGHWPTAAAGSSRDGDSPRATAVLSQDDSVAASSESASVSAGSIARPAARWVVGLEHSIQSGRSYLLFAWLIGITVLGSRLALGLAGVQRLKAGRRPIEAELVERFRAVANRLGMAVDGRIFASHRVRQAVVAGFWRPVVLLPLSWLAEMPPDALEAIVAHELAHIRRYDLWVSLVQRVLETLLFYHPAVWWLSRRLDRQRELCCDALAVQATGQRVVYVQALEQAARRRSAGTGHAVAAAIGGGGKMRILERVRHVLGMGGTDRQGRWWPLGLTLLLVPLTLWLVGLGISSRNTDAQAAEERRGEGEQREEVRRDGDREREREGAQERPREGGGDRPREGAREGDRPREGAREGDRPREGAREGDRPREGAREGDRPREGAREGDRPREGAREGDRPREGAREGDRPREGAREGAQEGRVELPRGLTEREASLMRLIMELRREMEELRREVRMLRERREGDRPVLREGDRPILRDGERQIRREGDRPVLRDGDRPIRGEGERPVLRDGQPREGERERAESSRREGRQADGDDDDDEDEAEGDDEDEDEGDEDDEDEAEGDEDDEDEAEGDDEDEDEAEGDDDDGEEDDEE